MAIDRMLPVAGALRAVAACAPAEHATNTQPHQQPGALGVAGGETEALPPQAADRRNPEQQRSTTTVVIVRRHRRRSVRKPA